MSLGLTVIIYLIIKNILLLNSVIPLLKSLTLSMGKLILIFILCFNVMDLPK